MNKLIHIWNKCIFKWTLMGQGKAYMDKCPNSSNRTKNMGLNKETNE